MRVVIVYESMFGNTRRIAEAIAEGLPPGTDVSVMGVAAATSQRVEGAELLVVGGPTHAWGMSRPNTRKGAPGYVAKPGSDLVLEAGADTGPGVREWIASLGRLDAGAAAFDTRIKGPFTGRASKGIARRLAGHGLSLVADPVSFLVDRRSHLLAGETDRARNWGSQLGASVSRSAARI